MSHFLDKAILTSFTNSVGYLLQDDRKNLLEVCQNGLINEMRNMS